MEALSYEDICDGIKIATASSISQTRPDFSHSLLSISVLFLSLREKVLMDFDIRTSFRRLKWSRGERQRIKSQLDGSHVRLSQLQKKRSGPAAPAALLLSSKEEDRRLESSQKHSRNPHAGSIKEEKRTLNKQNKTKETLYEQGAACL